MPTKAPTQSAVNLFREKKEEIEQSSGLVAVKAWTSPVMRERLSREIRLPLGISPVGANQLLNWLLVEDVMVYTDISLRGEEMRFE